MVAVASAAAGAAALWAWRRTSMPVDVAQLPAMDQPLQQSIVADVAELPVLAQSAQDIAEPGPIGPRQNRPNDPRFKLIWWASSWQGIIVSVALAAISAVLAHSGHRILARPCFL